MFNSATGLKRTFLRPESWRTKGAEMSFLSGTETEIEFPTF